MSTSASRYIAAAKARLFFIGLIAMSWAVSPVQTAGQLPEALSPEARVSLLTLLPGEPIYAAFAHSAIRFQDEQNGFDLVFNYGTFDPTAPYFVARFAYGEMDYYLSVYSMRLFMSSAVAENRSVIEQTFLLSADHKLALYDRLKQQARPENRIYRYDFLAENCSTILLDLLRETEGSSLRFDSTAAGFTTYRQLLQTYLEDRPFWDLGIDLVLGARIDRPVSYFERDFLPLELLRIVDNATIDTVSDSKSMPPTASMRFVSRTDTLLWVGQGYSDEKAFPWLPIIVWTVVLGLISRVHLRKNIHYTTSFRMDRWFFGVLGFLGLFLAFMWFGTYHYVTQYNWNIVWALPSHLVIALFWRRIKPAVITLYFYANAAVLVLLLAAQTIIPQQLHAAFLPFVVLICWRSWWLARTISRAA